MFCKNLLGDLAKEIRGIREHYYRNFGEDFRREFEAEKAAKKTQPKKKNEKNAKKANNKPQTSKTGGCANCTKHKAGSKQKI